MSSMLEISASESRVFGDADHPLNMGLNEGTYSPAACNEVFERFAKREACRRYSSSDNLPLKEYLAEEHGVSPGYIFLGHGSGPLLKEALILIIKSAVLRAPTRMAKYVLRRGGYPIITPVPSYSKVAAGALRNNLGLRTLALDASTNWELDLEQLHAAIREQDGLVYLCNPNNL
ncbi:MAG: aminotransferase class I/II-fold pyridoxal phosphate-dependent enzyme, partial [Myxococcota bacterium]